MICDRLISIFPNSNGVAFIILDEVGAILDYGNVSTRPVNNEKYFRKIKKIISYYLPKTLLVEDCCKYSRKSERVKDLINMICEYAKDFTKVYKYSRKQVKETFEVFGARNKFEISRKISEVYTQLQNKLPEKRRTWEPENYYQGIFDAMSLVIAHQYLID